jgi:predicted DNA binding CopG/RHH family protein
MNRPLQYFTKEYLERCKGMTSDQILEFLENYKLLLSPPEEKSQLISLKIEPSLLKAFKQRSLLEGVPYQTKMKQLMRAYLQT